MYRSLLFISIATILAAQVDNKPSYVLGPDDQLVIHALDAEEITPTPYRIDSGGNIDLPLLGSVHAGGLTVDAFRAGLVLKLKSWVKEPMVTVSITEFRSQPISILGAVNKPGAYQVRGDKTLFEVLSLAEGLRPDAGNSINITRRRESGPLPLANAKPDRTGKYLVAEVKVRSILEGKSPEDNIVVLPFDVISVPKAELIYVTGSVRKSGGFVLNERETMSVLQALSMAEGLDKMAAASKAKILRQPGDGSAEVEVPVDIKKILDGKEHDVSLQANDILFVPNSAAKNGTVRALEAALQVGTGIAIYRR